MTKLQIKEVNCATGEEILRDATDSEIAAIEKMAAEEAIRVANLEAQAAARQALLDKLGITEDEAKLLLGGN